MSRDLPPPDHPDADGRLAACFARDPGPASQEVATARLLLRRALAREAAPAARAAGIALRSPPRARVVPLFLQAAGFALLIALLVPTLPLVTPTAAAPRPDFATEIAARVRSLGEQVGRCLPSLPPLDLESALPNRRKLERALEPLRELGDELPAWWPALHSDAR